MRSGVVKRLLAVILGPLVFFGLLEGGLRLFGYRFNPLPPGGNDRLFDEWDHLEVYRPDPVLLWTLRPSTVVHALDLGIRHVRTNAQGFRGPEVPAEREPGELRVLCLGDSVTFGLDLMEADTVPAILARELPRLPGLKDRPVRVINAGLPGYSSYQGKKALERFAFAKPDIVIFWFGMNDAQAAREHPDRSLTPPGEEALKARSVLQSLRTFQLVQQGIMEVANTPVLLRVTPQEYGEFVDELIADAKKGGPRPIFVRYPNLLDLKIEQLEAVVARCEEEDVTTAYGPFKLLSPIGPAEPGTDLVGQRMRVEESSEPVLVFEPERVQANVTLTILRENLVILHTIRNALTLLMEELPPDAVTADEMFGDTPRHQVFADNCHLTPLGSLLAGRALARRIEEMTAD